MLALSLPAVAQVSSASNTSKAAFDNVVRPVLGGLCSTCHNEQLLSGGLNLKPFLSPASLLNERERWEKILRKIRSGEMPPPGVRRPAQAQIDALSKFVENEWERSDRRLPRDPGRVVVRRLNRSEYTNTIRDLLGVEFRADRQFPTDDLGYGFDNIGSVLTVSPVLMERYLAAAEHIASRALGADPLPPKPINWEYHTKDKKIRRLDFSTVEATHNVEWEAEYIVRFGLPGERQPDAKPVTLGFWMDGKLLNTVSVETKPSTLVYFNPYSETQMRLVLPEGDHVFRAGFINDDFVKNLSQKDAYDSKKNKFLNSITFEGPFPAKVERASRKKILVCDPNSGAACVNRILTSLAHRAYRRPVTAKEVAALARFVDQARAEGQTVEQGLQLAIQAMLVSPHFLFRVARDPTLETHAISGVEMASRLSYFLWSSMPDSELLALGESGRLREPAVLNAQVKRLLADPRAAALAENFAGQWLEIRNLEEVKPDPQKFPSWGPSLRDAMKTETRMFFESVIRENRPLSDFLDARYTFLNEQLAKHYGIAGVSGPDFRRVDLATDQRGGILSQASVLTVSSYPTRTSIVIRGKYVLQNILGAPPPPPPPDVPLLNEAAIGTSDSLRQQMGRHRADPMCASCHTRMDTLGMGLENYDALGRWRTADGKFPVDSSGTLPNGKRFTTPAELRRLLMNELPEFSRCLTEKMLTYALGRGLNPTDQRSVSEITRKVEASGYRSQTLVEAIVHSFPFQNGRGEVPKAPAARTTEVAKR
jgi:mono/diheme cytochrome c family protein